MHGPPCRVIWLADTQYSNNVKATKNSMLQPESSSDVIVIFFVVICLQSVINVIYYINKVVS